MNRFYNARLLVVSLVLAASGCSSSPGESPTRNPAAAPSSHSAAAPDDALVLDVASKVVLAGDRVQAVWPGFWAPEQAFVLWPFRGKVLLIAPAVPAPATSVPLSADEVPNAIAGLAYLVEDTLTPRRPSAFESAYRIEDWTVPGVGTIPAEIAALVPGDRVLFQLQYLYHEAFHAHQASTFAVRGGRSPLEEPFIEPREVTAPEFRAHMAVERRILAAAISVDDPDSLRSLSGDYLAVRGARLAALPESAEAEALVERKEGSAQLVGYHAGLIARHGNADDLSNHLRELLLAPHLEENVNVADRYRSQLYATGAAIGRVLDRLGFGWRESMADGASFPELLADAAGAPWPSPDPAPAAILERYDYQSLLSQASEYRQNDPLAQAEAYDGPAVMVVGLRPSKVQYAGQESKPVQGVSIYQEGTTLTATSARAILESRGHVVISDRRVVPARFTIQVASLPTVNGATPTAGSTRYESVQVEGEGLSIRIDAPVLVERDGETVMLYIQ